MANIVLFEGNQHPEFIPSANTPDYAGNPNAIINPDLSGVSGVPTKYWKRSGDNVVEMSQAEKDAVDQNELDNRKKLADNYIVNTKIALTALIKVINARLSASQKITKLEMVEALKNEIT